MNWLLVIAGALLAGALFLFRRSKATKAPKFPLRPGHLQVPVDMLKEMVDRHHQASLNVGRLRRGMQALIDHWPNAFTPEEIAQAQALVDETGEAQG